MLNTEVKTIDGVEYTCKMMPAARSSEVLNMLSELMGQETLGALAMGPKLKGIKKEQVEGLETLILLETMPGDSCNVLCQTVMEGVKAPGVGDLTDPEVFDTYFRGRIRHLYNLTVWSIQVNYQDFFDRKIFVPHQSKMVKEMGSSARFRKSPNCDPVVWSMVSAGDGLDLHTLLLLQTELSIVDLYNALEWRDICDHNAEVMKKHLERNS